MSRIRLEQLHGAARQRTAERTTMSAQRDAAVRQIRSAGDDNTWMYVAAEQYRLAKSAEADFAAFAIDYSQTDNEAYVEQTTVALQKILDRMQLHHNLFSRAIAMAEDAILHRNYYRKLRGD